VRSGSIAVAGADLLAMTDANVRRMRRTNVSMGVPESDVGVEPDDPRR